MDIRQLRYFVAVADSGSFSRAAERVHVAQSALSLHVRRLEDALGVALLVREPKGVYPTVHGEKLLRHARTILRMLHEAECDLKSAGGGPSGGVTIGIPSGVGRLFNAPLLEACGRELPQVSLQIVEVLPGLVVEWLASGAIQLGLSYEMREEAEGASLADEEFHLVCGAPEPGLDGSVSFSDLPRFPLVLPACSHNPQQCVAVQAKAAGVDLTIETRVDSLATILDLVRTRPARSILTPGACLAEWNAGGLYAYRIEPVMKRSVMLGVGSAAAADPAVRAVEAVVRRTAQRLVAEGAWPRRLPTGLPAAA